MWVPFIRVKQNQHLTLWEIQSMINFVFFYSDPAGNGESFTHYGEGNGSDFQSLTKRITSKTF